MIMVDILDLQGSFSGKICPSGDKLNFFSNCSLRKTALPRMATTTFSLITRPTERTLKISKQNHQNVQIGYSQPSLLYLSDLFSSPGFL